MAMSFFIGNSEFASLGKKEDQKFLNGILHIQKSFSNDLPMQKGKTIEYIKSLKFINSLRRQIELVEQGKGDELAKFINNCSYAPEMKDYWDAQLESLSGLEKLDVPMIPVALLPHPALHSLDILFGYYHYFHGITSATENAKTGFLRKAIHYGSFISLILLNNKRIHTITKLSDFGLFDNIINALKKFEDLYPVPAYLEMARIYEERGRLYAKFAYSDQAIADYKKTLQYFCTAEQLEASADDHGATLVAYYGQNIEAIYGKKLVCLKKDFLDRHKGHLNDQVINDIYEVSKTFVHELNSNAANLQSYN